MSRPRRVAILGTSGSGKTTLARMVAERLDCRHIELDAIYHQAEWTPIDADEMRRIVADHIAADRWVVDGSYRRIVGDIVMANADTVVWLDLPRRVVMPRVIWRSIRRVIGREEIWNGNRERLRNLFSRRPEDNIILWTWSTHRLRHTQLIEARRDPAHAHITWVVLTSPRQVTDWVASAI